MCEGAAAGNWVSRHYLFVLFDATFRVSRVLLDWVHGLLMCVASNVVVLLSSIKIGAPASKEGTWHHLLDLWSL
jgi:hypothetical protein